MKHYLFDDAAEVAAVKVEYVSLSIWNLVMADLRAKAHIASEKVVHLRDMPPEEWALETA